MSTHAHQAGAPGIPLKAGLWIAQILVALAFIPFGFMKLTMPIAELAGMMKWVADAPLVFVRAIGLIDIAGGVGMLLPALTRVRPGLTVAAALGCAALQVCAIIFHISRGEAMMTPNNFLLLALSVFVFWGRSRKAPIAPR